MGFLKKKLTQTTPDGKIPSGKKLVSKPFFERSCMQTLRTIGSVCPKWQSISYCFQSCKYYFDIDTILETEFMSNSKLQEL